MYKRQVYGGRLQALPCIVCELLRRDAAVRQLTFATVLGIHSLTGVRERSNKFFHLFFKTLHKVGQKVNFWEIFSVKFVQIRLSSDEHLLQLTHLAVLVLIILLNQRSKMSQSKKI